MLPRKRCDEMESDREGVDGSLTVPDAGVRARSGGTDQTPV